MLFARICHGLIYAYTRQIRLLKCISYRCSHMENAKGDPDNALSAVHYYLIHIFNMVGTAV